MRCSSSCGVIATESSVFCCEVDGGRADRCRFTVLVPGDAAPGCPAVLSDGHTATVTVAISAVSATPEPSLRDPAPAAQRAAALRATGHEQVDPRLQGRHCAVQQFGHIRFGVHFVS